MDPYTAKSLFTSHLENRFIQLENLLKTEKSIALKADLTDTAEFEIEDRDSLHRYTEDMVHHFTC